jgi:hypothetical protein
MKGIPDLRRIVTGATLTQAERLEAELRHARAMNEAKARDMAREMGSRYLLAKDYDGHYQPELHARRVA